MVCFLRFLVKVGLIRDRGIYYIGGSDVLPPPLRGEEEKNALLGLEQGDEGARRLLVEHNLRLVVYIARRFENTGTNLEDLISIGTIGLMKAIGTYRLDKNIKLATYASRCIENEILMYIRKIAGQKAEVSLDEPINLDGDGNELRLSDILGTDGDEISRPMEDNADLCVLRQVLRELPGRERRIIQLRFGLDGVKELTQKEVAGLLGISQSYISRLEKRIMGKLRKEFLRQTNCAWGMGEVQVRKDLAIGSSGGRPKIGYCRESLIDDIEQFLGYDNTTVAVLIGAGKLGQALMGYSGFEEYGLDIMAAFDLHPSIERTEEGKPVYPMTELARFCRQHKVLMGIITVPARGAQDAADQLIAVGVKAIWNFAPVHLDVPEGILVQNENMATSLAVLSVHLQAQIKEKNSKE